MSVQTTLSVLLGHNVDGPYQRRCTIDASGRTFEHLNALNVRNVEWEVEGIMPCLRVADVNAVEQDSDLLIVAASDTDVGLRSNRSTLADVYAYGIFQQIVNTLYRCRLNVGPLQHSDHSRLLTSGQRRTRAGHVDLLEPHFAACLGGVGLDGFNADAVGLGIGQGGHAQRPNEHFTTQTSKE